MAVLTKQQLYKSFENGDRPDETDFQNLIDSSFNGAFSTLGSLSAEKLKVVLAGTVQTRNITFGTDDIDSVTFNSDIASNLVPDLPTYTIGTNSKRWAEVFAGGAVHEPVTSSTIKLSVDTDLTSNAHHISFEELEIIDGATLNIYDEGTLNIINV